MKREPVLTAAAVTFVVSSFLSVLVVLDIVVWDVEQLGAVDVFLTGVVVLGMGLWARSRVTPA